MQPTSFTGKRCSGATLTDHEGRRRSGAHLWPETATFSERLGSKRAGRTRRVVAVRADPVHLDLSIKNGRLRFV
jgi:hypothetical protein